MHKNLVDDEVSILERIYYLRCVLDYWLTIWKGKKCRGNILKCMK